MPPIWHKKADTASKTLNRLNIYLKHAVALGSNVDLQIIEKTKALLEKQRHNATNRLAMDWRDIPAFYKILCKTTAITQLALHLLILTGIRTNPLRHIRIPPFVHALKRLP